MNTKTKGDILADKIEKLIEHYGLVPGLFLGRDLREALSEYLIAPVMVQLGPEDVPPGSSVRQDSPNSKHHIAVLNVCGTHIEVAGNTGLAEISFIALKNQGWLIHRPCTLATVAKPLWAKCEKEAK